jgi:integrase/recombinase XerD
MVKNTSKKRLYGRPKIGRGHKEGKEQLTLKDMFERFMLHKETEGLTRTTIRDYYIHFRYFLEYLEVDDVPNEDITLDLFRGYIGFMLHEKGVSPVSINVRIRTLRAFLRHWYLEEWIDVPIHERFKPIKPQEDTLASFTHEEVRALINSIDTSTFKGFRDLVIIYVLLDTMVRCSELIKIQRENVDLKAGFIQLEPHEKKTKRARIVPLSTKTIKLLKDNMDTTATFESDVLFVTYEGDPIADNTIRKNLKEWGIAASIRNKRVSPHTFRHTGALFYIMNGGDPFSLQKILGHTDMSMVRKYIQMTDTDVKRQHNKYIPLNYLNKC